MIAGMASMCSVLRSGTRRLVPIAGLIACSILAAAPATAKSYSAERFDSYVRVLPGGSLEVTETVAFRFESGTFDHVFREIPTRRTDGIEIVRASMDGRPFPRGGDVNQIQVTGQSKVRVQWRFHPIADSTHVFVLTYVARGVVTQTGDADVLAWRALPSEHQYRIASSTVEVELPGGASATAGAAPTPKVESHRIEGPVDATIRRGSEDTAAPPLVARATASGIRANGWLELKFDLARGSILTSPPAWQQAQLAAHALAPRWTTAAILITVSGLIVLFGLRQQYDPPRRDQPATSVSPSVPDSLAPGLVGPLLSNGRIAHEHAMATFFSLAERGVVSIEEQPRGFLGQQAFAIRRLPAKEPGSAHERALLAITLDETKIGQVTSLANARRRLVRQFRQFSAAVREDLKSAGLIDLDRKRVRDRYVRISIAVLVFAGVSMAAVGVLLVSRYGGWPMLVPAALALVGMTGLIFAAATTPLSNEGLRRAAGWRGFREYLRSLTQERRQPAHGGLDALLPFAVATGLAGGWAKYLKRHPGSAPPWFRALSASSRDGAFAAFVTSTGAHGSAGVGGGGAAGGGASGAG
jgi:Predicted membrane protein (DUF2207) C-terminal domain/Predicted membrane protein (DUF2207) N-terminal domain